jgi:uncharacterized membrane protein
VSEVHPLDCKACAAIDAFDGKIDGKVFNLDHWNVSHERKHFAALRKKEDVVADRITKFAGSLDFIYIHAVWFGIWVAANVGVFGASLRFDEFPFGLLTMLVSLEAIFLATFVMVSQNRQSARADLRAQVDFEANLQSLIWTVHVGYALNIDIEHVGELCRQAIEESRKTKEN